MGQPLSVIFTGYYAFTDQNVFVALRPGGKSIFVYIYPAILAAIVLSFLMRSLARIRFTAPRLPSFSEVAVTAAFAAFFTVFTAQTAHHFSGFCGEYARFRNMTQTEKKTSLRGLPYVFSLFCKQYLPGRHKAELISDLDITRDDARDAFAYGNLIYNLYPIDAGDISAREVDCLVVFSKEEPFIPARLYERFPEMRVMGNYYAVGTAKGED